MINRNFYNFQEVINLLAKKNITIGIDEIGNCIREGIITPYVYIDSCPIYACELIENKQALILGFCLLSAYWHVGKNIIAIYNNLRRQKNVSLNCPIIKIEDLTKIDIIGWSHDAKEFINLPSNLVALRNYSTELNIKCFAFLKNKPLKITIDNIVISQKELSILIEAIVQSEIIFLKQTSNPKIYSQREKEDMLMILISNIIHNANKKDYSFTFTTMPGTKAEFGNLIKELDPQFKSLTEKTMNDYFKRLNLKFKRGVKTGKCPIFKNLKDIKNELSQSENKSI